MKRNLRNRGIGPLVNRSKGIDRLTPMRGPSIHQILQAQHPGLKISPQAASRFTRMGKKVIYHQEIQNSFGTNKFADTLFSLRRVSRRSGGGTTGGSDRSVHVTGSVAARKSVHRAQRVGGKKSAFPAREKKKAPKKPGK